MKYILFLLLGSSLLITGCKKEAKLTPTQNPENVYGDSTLPQGNHPYDADILQLYKKYQTFFLYKYQRHDIYYNVNEDIGGVYDTATNTITKPGWFDVPADQNYVGVQLNLLKTLWLNYYPDSLLRQGLPQKVYLLDSFYFAAYPYGFAGPGKPSDYLYSYNYDVVYSGGDHMIATWGGSRITGMTQSDQYTFKSRLNSVFLAFAHAHGVITPITAFTAVTDYSSVNWGNYNALGLVNYGGTATPDQDWDDFVTTIVSNSYATLTSPGNVLDPSVDTSGSIQKKYNIIITFFKSAFGVDLQAIGNAGS